MGDRQMKYKGIEIEEITEPQLFNPPKRMLVWDDDGNPGELNVCAIVNREGFRVITERSVWRHCAEIPKPTFATHREFSRWLAEGRGEWKRASMNMVYTSISYEESMANDFVDFALVRKWGDTEWRVATREYLGLEDK